MFIIPACATGLCCRGAVFDRRYSDIPVGLGAAAADECGFRALSSRPSVGRQGENPPGCAKDICAGSRKGGSGMPGLTFSADQPVLVLVEVLAIMDAETMRDYVAAIAPQMAGYGARHLTAGLHTYKGETDAINMVASYWPTAQAYLDWQASAGYAPWAEKRLHAARIRTHFLPVIPGAFQ